jgi:hypothetical protein
VAPSAPALVPQVPSPEAAVEAAAALDSAQHQPPPRQQQQEQQQRQQEQQQQRRAAQRKGRPQGYGALEARLARLVDLIERRHDGGVSEDECRRAWDELAEARQALAEAGDEAASEGKAEGDGRIPHDAATAALDAMLTVTRWKLQQEREARTRLERELEITNQQLLRAIQSLNQQ